MTGDIKGKFKDQSFFDKNIALDGSAFVNCVFSKCTMVYSGGEVPVLSGCRFSDCGWQFGNEAANTIAFLSGMYRGGFDSLIESTFHEIRRGAMISRPVPPEPAKTGASAAARFLKPLRIFQIPKQDQ
ncbi:hypothetical protein [Hoeflea ulvae]|uniref:Uncharacterized protein n=1 Tax=Hoeflea ulvae TaxID=2983764 RepID=A0ABT3YCV0_9HYPH|nr:hypothetical protein [Hoeflea ulvae]MCY0093642.1 hypothetical protein [Hoeflea ulvae]